MDSDIASLRDKLYEMMESEEINSSKVLELSRELDISILKYYECLIQSTKTV